MATTSLAAIDVVATIVKRSLWIRGCRKQPASETVVHTDVKGVHVGSQSDQPATTSAAAPS